VLCLCRTSNETDELDNSDFIKIKVVIETDLSIKGLVSVELLCEKFMISVRGEMIVCMCMCVCVCVLVHHS